MAKPNNCNPQRGESHCNALLTNKQVLAIRKKWKSGKYMQVQLCEEYDVPRYVISKIVNNLSWTHLID